MEKGTIVYLVEALRFGDREKHSYVVGVYRDEITATLAAKAHRLWRAGKYECEIQRIPFNVVPPDEYQHFIEEQ